LKTSGVGVDDKAAAPAIVDGLVIVGAGAGSRGPDPTDPPEIEAPAPVDVTAF